MILTCKLLPKKKKAKNPIKAHPGLKFNVVRGFRGFFHPLPLPLSPAEKTASNFRAGKTMQEFFISLFF
jgi:hypothetical protein